MLPKLGRDSNPGLDESPALYTLLHPAIVIAIIIAKCYLRFDSLEGHKIFDLVNRLYGYFDSVTGPCFTFLV